MLFKLWKPSYHLVYVGYDLILENFDLTLHTWSDLKP